MIFVFDVQSGDVAVFPDSASAETYIEPADAANVEVLDAQGKRWRVEIDGTKTLLKQSDAPGSEGELRTKLLAFLQTIQEEDGLDTLNPSAFVEEAAVRISRWRRERGLSGWWRRLFQRLSAQQ